MSTLACHLNLPHLTSPSLVNMTSTWTSRRRLWSRASSIQHKAAGPAAELEPQTRMASDRSALRCLLGISQSWCFGPASTKSWENGSQRAAWWGPRSRNLHRRRDGGSWTLSGARWSQVKDGGSNWFKRVRNACSAAALPR